MAARSAQEQGAAPEELEIPIERLATGGDGIGHAPDGRVVFVPRTAPGDRVRARVAETQKRFLRAELLEVLEAGPGRVEPPCPVFGHCGGCSWQHLDYAAQLEAKTQALRDAFERLARITPPADLRVHACPEPFGYRGRARVVVEGGVVGFRAAAARDVVPVEGCPILAAPLDAALGELAEKPPQDAVGEWELALGDDGAVRIHALSVRGGPKVALDAPGTDTRLEVSPGVFFQANAPLRGALGEAALEAMGTGSRALELHAGAGFLTLGLARRFSSVVAIESHAEAVRDLRETLHAGNVRGVKVERARVEIWLARARRSDFEAVLLDPPRTGLPRGVAARLAALGAARIVYVSCDPATLARDCAALTQHGYALAALEGFDLFPQTAHLEAVAVLERG